MAVVALFHDVPGFLYGAHRVDELDACKVRIVFCVLVGGFVVVN